MASERFLSGKVAVVTGAGGGIGRAEAIALAQAGASVVVNDLGVDLLGLGKSSGPAEEVVAEITKNGGNAVANFESVVDFECAGRIIQQAVDTFGRIDILINNAGIQGPDSLEEHTPEEFDRVIGIHLKGTFNTCKHAVPHMKAQRYGRIVNTASNAWSVPTGRVGYAAAKGAIVSFSWALAWELASFGITVNALAPFGSTRMSPLGDAREKKMFEAGLMTKERYYKTPVRPDPHYMTAGLLYLLTDDAAEINGCVIRSGAGKVSRFTHPDDSMVVWRDYEKDGPWTVEQLKKILPSTLFANSKKAPHL
jgi:NAD(P)-dependent dehydrogenase (short-subunit alcohol dehydrogenase family)